MTALLDLLRQTVGADHVLTHELHDLAAYVDDRRQRHQGRALAVVQPANTAEVAAVVRVCAQHGTSIVPQGGNTGLAVGSVPDASGTQVVLNLQRMNAVRALDAANLTLTVEAGCILQRAQQAAEAAGLLLPLSLASEGSCTIGGNLATNAGGTQVVRYGNARDLCLGLEVVTPQGEVWNGLSGLRKDNTGYDLRGLYVGSEGTLGVITAATLKLCPQPAAQLSAWAAVPSLPSAVALLQLAQRLQGPSLTGFELMNHHALSLVQRHFPQLPIPLGHDTPCSVLLECSDTEGEAHAHQRLEALLHRAMTEGCASDAVVAHNLQQARGFWHTRESISAAQAAEGLNVKHDISLPISRIPDFCAWTESRLAQTHPGVRLVTFGHLGDGNLHYNVQAPVDSDPAAFLQEHETGINDVVFDAVQRFGGSISAEHGIGSLRVGRLVQYKGPVAMGLMHAIKQALDPDNLLNPGRVLARPPSTLETQP